MKTFDQLELLEPVRLALDEAGYREPTPIQSKTIPIALTGRDILGCAQTGTGKTAAFGLPILNHLGKRSQKALPNRPLALVLAPTRELAIQIGESFGNYGKHLHQRTVLVYGGVNQAKQVRQLRRGVHILVATPGRLLDLMQQREIAFDRLSMFVLDEADRMLDMGFLPDLKRIVKRLPTRRQSLFFSATLPPNIIQLSREFLSRPVQVNVTPKSKTIKQIAQQVMLIDQNTKQAALRAIVSGANVDRLLAFTRTKRTADRVTKRLVKAGVRAAAIHGDKSQNARVKALESFRSRQVQVLVATDVAARGIDVDGVTHVVNFDMPEEPENYLHRIGRTGRAGSTGCAISLCSGNEKKHLRSIERMIGKRVPVIVPQWQTDDQDSETQSSESPRRTRFRHHHVTISNVEQERTDGSQSSKKSPRKRQRKRQRNRKRAYQSR